MSNFILLFFLFTFISTQKQGDDSANITHNQNEDIKFTFEEDPFDSIDFGYLIWLDDKNATSEIEKHEVIFVLFYSPWCEPCLNFLPIYVQAAMIAQEKKLDIKFAKINGSNNTKTSKEFELTQFPSLFLIYKGKRYLYEGKREAQAIIKFVDRKKNDDIITFDSLAPIKEYINTSILTLLCTIKDQENTLYKSFKEFSKLRNNIDFIVCKSDECIKEYEENIILFKEFDEQINIYTKEMGSINNATSNSLNEFLAIYSVESGGMLSSNEVNMMFQYKRNMLMYFRNNYDEKQTSFDNIIKEIGLELRKKKIYAVISDIQEDPIQEQIAKAFMVLSIDLPAILLYDQNINSKEEDLAFLYIIRNIKEEQFNKEYLLKYIDDIIAGKAKKTLYSEPPMENYYKDGIKTIIGRTFDSDVIENKNNVLLALTNGAIVSKGTDNILNIMKNLAKKYNEKEDKILFAYSDAQKNEPRDVVIAGKTPPIVLLYTNALDEKKKIELKSENFTNITEAEVENFLMENLGWTQKKEYKQDSKVIKDDQKEEIKDEKIKENKEMKKEENKDKDKDSKESKDKAEKDKKMNTDL